MNAIVQFTTLIRNNALNGPTYAGTKFLTQAGTTYAPDVTPLPVDWGDTTYVRGQFPVNNIAQIDGIDIPITLRLEWSGTPGIVRYKVSASSFNQFDYGVLPATWTTITTGSTFSVGDKDFVGFVLTGAKAGSTVFTVRNAADGNKILDTFTMTLT